MPHQVMRYASLAAKDDIDQELTVRLPHAEALERDDVLVLAQVPDSHTITMKPSDDQVTDAETADLCVMRSRACPGTWQPNHPHHHEVTYHTPWLESGYMQYLAECLASIT
jgi:hypothetical protein